MALILGSGSHTQFVRVVRLSSGLLPTLPPILIPHIISSSSIFHLPILNFGFSDCSHSNSVVCAKRTLCLS
jgi:hypothetical protein